MANKMTVEINGNTVSASAEDIVKLLSIAKPGNFEVKVKESSRTKSAKTEKTASKTKKGYPSTTESFDDFAFVVQGKNLTYTHKDGSYLQQKAVRQVLNSRIKKAGAKYDKDSHAWVFGSKKACKDFAENEKNRAKVTPEELNAIYEAWNKKINK